MEASLRPKGTIVVFCCSMEDYKNIKTHLNREGYETEFRYSDQPNPSVLFEDKEIIGYHRIILNFCNEA